MARTARRICIALAALAILPALAGAGDGEHAALAQVEHRAGLVIQFADGSTRTYCIPFTGDSITGLDLLLKTGLDVQVEAYGAMGALVCKIGQDGCDYPQQPCACMSYGPGGAYWSYHHLKDGTWHSASTGAGGYKVRDGDVEGWAWSGGKPPALTPALSQLCAVAAPPATATAKTAAQPTRLPPTPQSKRPSATPTARQGATVTGTATPQSAPLQPTHTVEQATSTPNADATTTPTDTATLARPPEPVYTRVPTQTRAPESSPTPLAAPARPPGSGESTARVVAIVVGLFSAVGVALWRIVAGTRRRDA